MDVKPGILTALTVLILPVARNGDEPKGSGGRFAPQSPGHLIAVHLRQSQIAQHYVGSPILSRFDSGTTGWSNADFMPVTYQQRLQRPGSVIVVFDDQYAPGFDVRNFRRAGAGSFPGFL